MEAEIKAVDQLILELIYLMDLLNFLGIENQTPISIYCDNKNAVDLCNTIKQSHKTKVINMRVHFICDMIKRGFVVIKFIRSIYNVADVLTKSIPADQHEVLTEIVLTGHKGNHPEQWVEQVLIINDEQELVIIANSEYLGRKDF